MTGLEPILVFDSGVGGFSILKELQSILPHDYLYLADQAYFPYGDKDPSWVRSRIETLVEYGIKEGVSAIVIACNTATVHSIADLREKYHLPIFGVEPVIKPLANYQHAGLLATVSTANSPRVRELMREHLGEHLAIIGVHGLAAAIEDMDQDEITRILTKLNTRLSGIEALGLSCTHYPLAKSLIKSLYPNITLIDPSTAVAEHIKKMLGANGGKVPTTRFVTTGNVLRLEDQILHYLGARTKVTQVEL